MAPNGSYALTGNSYDFALVRYNADGSLDTSFGAGGKVTTDIGGSVDQANALVQQGDGKLVAAGYAFSGRSYDFALVRYNADGSLDTTFGTGGKVTTDFPGGNDFAAALVRQNDGNLVAAGYTLTGSSSEFAVARYSADGNLDTTFGTDGKVVTDFAGSTDQAFGLVLQSDGKLVAAGRAIVGGFTDFALARYKADGSLDPTFGTGGKVTTDFAGADDGAFGLVLQSDGKLVAAGLAVTVYPPISYDFALARYQAGRGCD